MHRKRRNVMGTGRRSSWKLSQAVCARRIVIHLDRFVNKSIAESLKGGECDLRLLDAIVKETERKR